MKKKGTQNISYIRQLRLIFAAAFLSLVNAWGEPPDNQCTLRFDSEGVKSVSFRNVQSDSNQYEEKQCTNSQILLPPGTYEIDDVKFEGGLRIGYKNKQVTLTPENETVITFNKPSDEYFEIKKRGTFLIIEYNPKAFYDEEFYSNRSHPPTVQCRKGDRLVYSKTFEYG